MIRRIRIPKSLCAPWSSCRNRPIHPSIIISSKWYQQTAYSSRPSAEKCPYGSGGLQESNVKLVDVPRLPLFGSMLHQYSKTEKIDLKNIYGYFFGNWKRFGDFYKIGIISRPKGIGTQDAYILTDPNEYMKVLRASGQYPRGALESHWPLRTYFEEVEDRAATALLSRGPEWQRIRRFLQTDLLHPSAAKGYLPSVITACRIASEGAPMYSNRVGEYTTFASFDMFSAVALGDFPGLASGRKDQEEDLMFCTRTVEGLRHEFPLLLSPLEKIKRMLGVRSAMYKTFQKEISFSREIAFEKVRRFKERKDAGVLANDFERNSYASLSFDRYEASVDDDDALKVEEITEILIFGLIAALDTTSTLINWTIIHLAMNPTVQERLYEEISEHPMNAEVGGITPEYLTTSHSSYLDAILRENHRITPAVHISLIKTNETSEIEIHGVKIPKGSLFILDSRSLGMDESYVVNPDVFDPSRWEDEKVEERKGTPMEKLDHALYKQPFSAGARKCPGSRVATYEAKAFISQLVLDWKISLSESEKSRIQSWRDVPYSLGLTVQPESPELKFEKRQ